MFIRFVAGLEGEGHRSLTGIITEARLLREQGGLDEYQSERLEELYTWFNDHVPCPPFSSAGWIEDAVAWFKDDAGPAIAKMWELAALLRECGVPVRMLRSASPGKILYEDSHQVVVEEWARLER
ncbi:MAG TPA: hypothetical protein VGF59_30040 [Bryobacteraceae bacterium]